MPYCTQCGKEIEEDAKFCSQCGAPISRLTDIPDGRRKIVFDGEVHKCPNCGEVLEAFSSECPYCGYELRETKSSHAVKEFAQKLGAAKAKEEKISLIRNFPIPNNKEDILEFMIIAATNVDENVGSELFKAWQAKVEQAHKKSEIIIQNKHEREKVQKIYDDFYIKLNRNKVSGNLKRAGGAALNLLPIFPHIIIIVTWLCSIFVLIPLCRINLDSVGANGHQVLLIFDLIAGAIVIPYLLRSKYDLPRLIMALGICLSIILIIPRCKENLYGVGINGFQMILIIEIICVIIITIRAHKKKPDIPGENKVIRVHVNRMGGLLSLICIAIFVAAYAFSSYSIKDELKFVEINAGFQWLESGLSTKVPEIDAREGEIWENSDIKLNIELESISYQSFEKYVSDCRELGYNIDAVKDTNEYIAYNNEGFLLELSLIGDRMGIELQAPIVGEESFSWPENYMASLIPEMAGKKGILNLDEDEKLEFVLCDISDSELKEYFNSCQEIGFNIDIEHNTTSFTGYNEDGYKLFLNYGDMKDLSVKIEAPMTFSELSWPSSGPATLIPEPDCDGGIITSDYDWSFAAYLNGVNIDEFNSYIESCIDDGFEKDYRSEHYFSADKGEKISLTVEYIGYDIIYIYINNRDE